MEGGGVLLYRCVAASLFLANQPNGRRIIVSFVPSMRRSVPKSDGQINFHNIHIYYKVYMDG
jgi:hypothetical protein